MLPDAQGFFLGDLQFQQPPFTLHFDHIQPDDAIGEFHGVIGQDGEIVHTGDYVELSSAHHEVCLKDFLLVLQRIPVTSSPIFIRISTG